MNRPSSSAASALQWAIVPSIPWCGARSGANPAQRKVLPRHLEPPLQLDVVAPVRVAHKRDAVGGAPFGQAAVIDLALPLKDQPLIQPRGIVCPALKQGGQLRQLAAFFRKQSREPAVHGKGVRAFRPTALGSSVKKATMVVPNHGARRS